MPIAGIEGDFPVIGKIRLGVRSKSKSGVEYPTSVPHFVLHDAPDVERVYGAEPTELDAFFLSDDEEKCIPHWYKLFAGGSKDKKGNIVGGKLQCMGDGRTAQHFAERDPLTRIVPTRECLASKCPDWSKGCKQTMNVYVWVPLANLGGVYQIDTTSWNSIHSFVNQVTLMKNAFKKLSGIPFKITREAKKTTYVDPKTGKEKSGTQYIMMLKPNPDFWERCGDDMNKGINSMIHGGQAFFNPSQDQLTHAPMEDHYALKAAPSTNEKQDAMATIEAVAEDSVLLEFFNELSMLKKGKDSTPKMRLMTARKFEKSTDPAKDLHDYLIDEIGKAKASAPPQEKKTSAPPQEAKTPEVITPPPAARKAAAKTTAPVNEEGLI